MKWKTFLNQILNFNQFLMLMVLSLISFYDLDNNVEHTYRTNDFSLSIL